MKYYLDFSSFSRSFYVIDIDTSKQQRLSFSRKVVASLSNPAISGSRMRSRKIKALAKLDCSPIALFLFRGYIRGWQPLFSSIELLFYHFTLFLSVSYTRSSEQETNTPKGEPFMSGEENKANVRRVFEEGWNQGNTAVFDELFAADYLGHDPSGPIHGPEGFKQYYATYRAAFPDTHLTIEDQIAEGDKVVTRWTATGTNQGTLMGIPPSGKRVTITGISITRIANGKAVEDWVNFDTLGMLQQIGAIPTPG